MIKWSKGTGALRAAPMIQFEGATSREEGHKYEYQLYNRNKNSIRQGMAPGRWRW